MKIMKSSGFVGSLLLVGTLLFSGGCGYKNTPIPPEDIVPKAIEDLRYTIEDTGAMLTWSYPVETISGDNIPAIDSFELFRAEVALADFCSTCPIPFREPMKLPGGVNSDEERRRAKHMSGMLRSGYKYFFKVRSSTSWWASSADSNIVTFVFHTLVSAPADLQVKAEHKKTILTWSPVTTLIDGNQAEFPLNYQVMKSEDNKEFKDIGTPVAATTFVDAEAEAGKKYYYKVKSSMLMADGTRLDGSSSDSILAVVEDVTPPAMVTGVTVVASTTNNRVFWDRVKDAGLAGYRVYRRTAEEKTATLIGKAGPTQTIFIDAKVPQGSKVYYSVTAIDNAKPANESKRSKEVTTRH